MKRIKVAELFAGVGGFRLALNRASSRYDVVWADQYEPSRKAQFAFDVYCQRFGEKEIINDDITLVKKNEIPDIDLLVGGFPCQDYSVAKTVSTSKGIYGKKGVLWWDILKTVRVKKPRFLFLENVDRLLKSPGVNSDNPGRDFGMILRTLNEYNYSVQWKMINAADYGEPQRRRRTFIFAFRNDTEYGKKFNEKFNLDNLVDMLKEDGPLNAYLPNSEVGSPESIPLYNEKDMKTLVDFSNNFRHHGGFGTIGIMIKGTAYTTTYKAKGKAPIPIGKLLDSQVKDQSLFLSPEAISKMKKLRGKASGIRTSRKGYPYPYTMGSVQFPDQLNKPARTMVTSERSISRMTHVIMDPVEHRLRFISPEEAEKINTFPIGWTDIEGISRSARYFLMGNALVVDLVSKIGKAIADISEYEPERAGHTDYSDKIDVEIPNTSVESK